ncbi:RETINOL DEHYDROGENASE [Salix purpurea]|uniref:RETINOL DEHYDROGENASE n=1 Tax=Salix purpurea TaxID=77065 RepID=A0A9Q0QFG8_SALPP|nr:RETINOL DEHYDROGENASE [Salix purpurea]
MLETLRYLVGSAGASGYGSKSTAEQVTENCRDLHSITAIITGATSGIGAETARVLAKRGVRLVLPARNLKAAEDARARILSENPDADIIVMGLDLSSLNSVRNFVSEFESLNLPLNLLINNAGKFALEPAGRIVNVSSSIYKWFSGDMIRYLCEISRNKLRDFDPTRAYALSKLAIVLHTKEVAQRLKQMEANVTVNCVHPGVVRTRLTREREGMVTDIAFFLTSKLLKTIPQAAATTCYVATHPALVNATGKYFSDCNEASTSKLGSNSTEAARLWTASEIMVRSIFWEFNSEFPGRDLRTGKKKERGVGVYDHDADPLGFPLLTVRYIFLSHENDFAPLRATSPSPNPLLPAPELANLTPEALRSAAKQSERCHIVPLPSKSTSEVRGRLPGFSPTKVLDFGAGTGSAFCFAG